MDDAQGACDKSVVKVDKTMALILLIVNILFSGIGTMISACIGPEFNSMALIFGILQLICTFLIFGWCWSIYHGVLIYKKAEE